MANSDKLLDLQGEKVDDKYLNTRSMVRKEPKTKLMRDILMKVGSQERLSRLVGITRQTAYNWSRQEKLSYLMTIMLEKLCKFSGEELNRRIDDWQVAKLDKDYKLVWVQVANREQQIEELLTTVDELKKEQMELKKELKLLHKLVSASTECILLSMDAMRPGVRKWTIDQIYTMMAQIRDESVVMGHDDVATVPETWNT